MDNSQTALIAKAKADWKLPDHLAANLPLIIDGLLFADANEGAGSLTKGDLKGLRWRVNHGHTAYHGQEIRLQDPVLEAIRVGKTREDHRREVDQEIGARCREIFDLAMAA